MTLDPGFVGMANMGLRVVAVLLAFWNIHWSWRGVCALSRGQFTGAAIIEGMVFWLAVGVLGFQITFALGANEYTRLFSYITLTVTQMLAVMAHRLGVTAKMRQLRYIMPHIDLAMAIVELAQLDPASAAELASAARRRTAKAITDG